MSHLVLLIKAKVKHPGSRGGVGYWDQKGWHYGRPPVNHPHHSIDYQSAEDLVNHRYAKVYNVDRVYQKMLVRVLGNSPKTVEQLAAGIENELRHGEAFEGVSYSDKEIHGLIDNFLSGLTEVGLVVTGEQKPLVEVTHTVKVAHSKDDPVYFKEQEIPDLSKLSKQWQKPYERKNVPLMVNGKPVVLSDPDMEEMVYIWAKRRVGEELKAKKDGKPVDHFFGVRDEARYFKQLRQWANLPKEAELDYSAFERKARQDIKHDKDHPKEKKPDDTVYSAVVDGAHQPLDKNGKFPNPFIHVKGDLKGRFFPRIHEEWVTFNGTKVPSGWKGKVVNDPSAMWVLRVDSPHPFNESTMIRLAAESERQKDKTEEKFNQAMSLASKLPKIQSHIFDLYRSKNPVDNQTALAMEMLFSFAPRVGGEGNDGTGLTTLEKTNIIEVKGRQVHVRFRSKSNVLSEREFEMSRAGIRVLKERLTGSDDQLFPNINDSSIRDELRPYGLKPHNVRHYQGTKSFKKGLDEVLGQYKSGEVKALSLKEKAKIVQKAAQYASEDLGHKRSVKKETIRKWRQSKKFKRAVEEQGLKKTEGEWWMYDTGSTAMKHYIAPSVMEHFIKTKLGIMKPEEIAELMKQKFYEKKHGRLVRHVLKKGEVSDEV